MTHYTPLHHCQHDRVTPNGRVHLSSQVLRLDDRRPIYRKRPRTLGDLVLDLTFRFVFPALILAFCVLAWVGLFWILVAIGRAIRTLGGTS